MTWMGVWTDNVVDDGDGATIYKRPCFHARTWFDEHLSVSTTYPGPIAVLEA